MSENQESSPVKSYTLVTNELMKKVLQKDKGSDAELLFWEIIPFTNKGDNVSSIVISISVRYRKDGMEYENSYVAKLNPLRPFSSLADVMEKAHPREAKVLGCITEGMSNQLKMLGLDPIRTPRLLAEDLEKGREAIVTENLRNQGFKLYDRMKGMDLNHSLFVVKELGRFHASSLLFEAILKTNSITETFNDVKGAWLDKSEGAFETYRKVVCSTAISTAKFLKKYDPKYEKCSNWLHKHAPKLGEYYRIGLRPCNHFDVLIHGDCWSNNMLFRYNEDGIPVDFRFVDFQCSSKASATFDLNYFFYVSLNGDFRLENYNTLITAYYESFLEVMRRSGKKPRFSYLDLKQELHDRKIFGLVIGMLVLPYALSQGEDSLDIDNFSDDTLDEFTEVQSKNFEKMAKTEGPFKDRYVAIFEEMIETSIFNEDLNVL